MRYLLVLISWMFGVGTLFSQCEIELGDSIFSGETGDYQVIVEGLINDQLGINQSLCGVQLEFSHNSITNLRITLTSPAGDIVYLVGPATTQGSISAFIDWDVTFIPCTGFAAPDPDIPAQWSNSSGWTSIASYDGTYYPNAGCLEDFNIGPANGIWTITVEDLGLSNSGELVSVELIFCEPAGLTCAVCDVQLVNYQSGSYYYCEGQDIQFVVDDIFVGLSSAIHEEYLLLVQNGNILQIVDDVLDLSNLPAGTYQVYGIVTQGDITSYSQISNLLTDANTGDLCADISDEVIDVVIGMLNGEETITETLCEGNSYLWRDQVLFAPLDTIIFINTAAGCDSLFRFQLNEFSVISEIDPIFGVIQCGEELVLSANTNTTSQTNATYQWYTLDGSIVAGENTPFLIVNQPGEYFLSIENNGCLATSSLVLESADNFEPFSLALDQQDCAQGIYTIINDVIVTVDEFTWLYNGVPFVADFEPTVTQSGTYTLVIESEDLVCGQLSANITIEDVTIPQLAILKTSNIDCINNSATLYLAQDISSEYNLTWLYQSTAIDQDVNSITVSQAGEYELQVTLSNGCVISEYITVENEVANYTTELSLDSLSCATQEGQLFINTDGSIAEVEWRGPFGFYSIDLNPRVFRFGTYRVDILFDDGCTQRLFIEVDYDIESPVIELSSSPIDCNNDFGVLYVTSGHQVGYLYNWAGPGGFESSLNQPVVYAPGNYFVTVTDLNGCETFYFQNVAIDTLSAQFAIQAQDLSCTNLATDLLIDYDVNLIDSILWTGPGITPASNLEITPNIALGGNYTLAGFTTNGCSFEQSIEVGYDTISPILFGPFDYDQPCENLEVTLASNTQGNIVGYEWSEPFELSPNLVVSSPGTYTLTITEDNGCTASDTYTITQADPLPVVEIAVDSLFLTCIDTIIEVDVAVVDATMIGNYQWSIYDQDNNLNPIQVRTDGSLYFEVNEEGQHRAEILSEIGCVLADTITIVRDTSVVAPIIPLDTFTCSTTNLEVAIENSEEFSTLEWYLDGNFSSSGPTESYFDTQELVLVAIGNNGCDTTLTIETPRDTLVPEIILSEMGSGDCSQINSTLDIEVSNTGDVVQFWSTQDGNILTDSYEQSITVDMPGTYLCVVTDQSSSCSTSSMIVVSGSPFVSLDLDVIQPSCPEDDGQLANIVVQTFTGLSNDELLFTLDGIELDYSQVESVPLNSGEHALQISDGLGCSIDTLFIIDEVLALDLVVEDISGVAIGDSTLAVAQYNISAAQGSISFIWETNTATSDSAWYTPIFTQDYQVTALYGDGCSESTQFEIMVEEESFYFANNIFNPGLGGEDSQLTIIPTTAIDQFNIIQIFDRWGNMILSKSSVIDALNWDGTYNGALVEQGVYMVSVSFVTTDGRNIREIFDVTVVR